MNKYKYILCPPGNGLDTHRMWETLYAESIPVINNNYTYSSASNLATFKIDNFFKLSIKNLNEYQYKTISKDQLNIDYWFKKIRKNLIPNNQEELCINESDKKQKDVISKYHEDLDKIKRIKKLKTFERKIKEYFNMIKKTRKLIKDVLFVSKITNVTGKKKTILFAVLLAQISALTDILIILFFSVLITNDFPNFLIPYESQFEFFKYFIPIVVIFRYLFQYMQGVILKRLN